MKKCMKKCMKKFVFMIRLLLGLDETDKERNYW